MKFQYTLLIFVVLFVSCNSSGDSEHDQDKLQEAQEIHNEAMATFAEARRLLDEVTQVRSEIRRKSGIEEGGPTNQLNPETHDAIRESGGSGADTTTNNQTTGQRNIDAQQRMDQKNTGDQGTPPADANNNSTTNNTTNSASSENQVVEQDTNNEDTVSVDNETREILDNLNQAETELLSWMKEIYTVPGLNEGSEGEKTKDPALGMDYDSRRLSKDIKFKEYPEGTSIDEIIKEQKEMKENIDRIYEDMRKAIDEGKTKYAIN